MVLQKGGEQIPRAWEVIYTCPETRGVLHGRGCCQSSVWPHCWLELAEVTHPRLGPLSLEQMLLYIPKGAALPPEHRKCETAGAGGSAAQIPRHTQVFLLGALLLACRGLAGSQRGGRAQLQLSTHNCRRFRTVWSSCILKNTANSWGVTNPGGMNFTCCTRQGCRLAEGARALLRGWLLPWLRGRRVLPHQQDDWKERPGSSVGDTGVSTMLLCLCSGTSLYSWWRKTGTFSSAGLLSRGPLLACVDRVRCKTKFLCQLGILWNLLPLTAFPDGKERLSASVRLNFHLRGFELGGGRSAALFSVAWRQMLFPLDSGSFFSSSSSVIGVLEQRRFPLQVLQS